MGLGRGRTGDYGAMYRGSINPVHCWEEETMSERKAVKTQELQVDIGAPIEAGWKALTEAPGLANWFAPLSEVSGPGVGAEVKNGWSEEMMMTGTVTRWEPQKQLTWMDDSGWMGPGTALAIDYHLAAEKGVTRVRLVQSAFGEA